MFSIVRPIENDRPFRQNIRNTLKTLLEKRTRELNESRQISLSVNDTETPIPFNKYATHLERTLYNETIKMASVKKVVKKWNNKAFVNLYITRFRGLYLNLEQNDTILEKLLKQEWKARYIPSMTAQELCPEKWNKLIELKLERDKNLFNEDEQAATDQFTCWKCKKNKCVFYELQTSSGDESTTIFITCLSCGNRWKTR